MMQLPAQILPDGVSYDGVQDFHLVFGSETGQVGSQSLAETPGFLPGAFPAQSFLVKHLKARERLTGRLKQQEQNRFSCFK